MKKIYELKFENPELFFMDILAPSITITKTKKKILLTTWSELYNIDSEMYTFSEAIYFMKVFTKGYKSLYPNMKITFNVYLLNKRNEKLKIMNKEIKAES